MIRVFCAVCGEMGVHGVGSWICRGCGAIGPDPACACKAAEGSAPLSTATRQGQGCLLQAVTQIVPQALAPMKCPRCKKAMLKGSEEDPA